jgi:crotonobetainyl-CoA:carnitine CoA-transferase CaiB-like acyl-CoA transferase
MSFLGRYRVLDLTDHGGLIAGRMLADLGADVVQVEGPGGSRARSMAPLDPDGGSFFWATYAANKRGFSVDPEAPAGQEALARLVGRADVLIESAGADVDQLLGLTREIAVASNPGLIWCSITPFGATGPKAGYAASDLVVWAASGALHPSQDESGRPVRISSPQAYKHAGADAAVGVLLALLERSRTGRGQSVEISAQLSASFATLGTVVGAPTLGGPPQFWRCRDGWLQFALAPTPTLGAFTANLFTWMSSEKVDIRDLEGFDWVTSEPDAVRSAIEKAHPIVTEFFAARSMVDIVEGASKYKVLCAPIMSVAGVAESRQLRSRDVWTSVGDGPRRLTLPGPFASIDSASVGVRRPAPRLGEHNAEVLEDWSSGPAASIRSAPRPAPAKPGILKEIRVVDFSWAVAGPAVGRALADFGATVIRVESSRKLDTARSIPPLYETTNAGKLGLCLDLTTPGGLEVAKDLIRWADIVVESFSPGVMTRLGLDLAHMCRDRPSLIALSTTLCGQDGPWSSFAGFGNAGSALAGLHDLTGNSDRPPVGPYGPYTDYMAPRYALATILAALDRRAETGRGCWIDMAQVEAAIQFLSPELADYFATGYAAERAGNRDLQHVPHGVFECRPSDGDPAWVAIAVPDDGIWARLAEVLRRDGVDTDPSWGRADERRGQEVEVETVLEQWTRTLAATEVEQILQGAGVPCHTVVRGSDFPDDSQVRHLGYVQRVPHPELGEVQLEGSRYRLQTAPSDIRRAPMMNEHAHQVLIDLLGYPAAKVDDLEQAGVLR